MNNLLLQDMRKKVTKQAYKQAVIDSAIDTIEENSHYHVDVSNINEVSEYIINEMFLSQANYKYNRQRIPNIYDRVTDWLQGLPLAIDYETYVICQWLENNNLVASNFIKDCKDEQMTEAADRHFYYIAKTILDNVSSETFSKVLYGTD